MGLMIGDESSSSDLELDEKPRRKLPVSGRDQKHQKDLITTVLHKKQSDNLIGTLSIERYGSRSDRGRGRRRRPEVASLPKVVSGQRGLYSEESE